MSWGTLSGKPRHRLPLHQYYPRCNNLWNHGQLFALALCGWFHQRLDFWLQESGLHSPLERHPDLGDSLCIPRQIFERFKVALTICARVPPKITGKIWRKSPPNSVVIHPNVCSICVISRSVWSTVSTTCLCDNGTLSHIIKSVRFNRLARSVFSVILQVDSPDTFKGILNLECAVRPPTNSSAAGMSCVVHTYNDK